MTDAIMEGKRKEVNSMDGSRYLSNEEVEAEIAEFSKRIQKQAEEFTDNIIGRIAQRTNEHSLKQVAEDTEERRRYDIFVHRLRDRLFTIAKSIHEKNLPSMIALETKLQEMKKNETTAPFATLVSDHYADFKANADFVSRLESDSYNSTERVEEMIYNFTHRISNLREELNRWDTDSVGTSDLDAIKGYLFEIDQKIQRAGSRDYQNAYDTDFGRY